MTWPDNSTLFLLLALYGGAKLDVTDGRLTIEADTTDGPIAVDSLPEALDALESRGWIDLATGVPVVTDKGRYAVKRFVSRKRVVA